MTPSDIPKSDSLIQAVQADLDAIWPEEMRRQTGSGLQWGQLVATVAVESVRKHSAAFSTKGANDG